MGFSLSLLIFTLTLKPLLRMVHNTTEIWGFFTHSGHHNMAAYADNLLFFLSQPGITLPKKLPFNTYSGNVLTSLWSLVEALCCELTEAPISNSPLAFLLHFNHLSVMKYKNLSSEHSQSVLSFPVKTELPSHFDTLFFRITETMQMEDLTVSLYHQEETFSKTWYHWQDFCSTLEYRFHLLHNLIWLNYSSIIPLPLVHPLYLFKNSKRNHSPSFLCCRFCLTLLLCFITCPFFFLSHLPIPF